ncbi:DUF2188 domain-containing protein [Pediococcus inopinatus]|jgi:uncharacterized protein YdaT|uniref:DUF2188 domain-containing protein n=1 Tax=Pediococcus inopinatus TaxID=114090 RepID=A0ABZ0Q586_9LACO|nr:DUF2188 domain-containing protein [Pediococcus inopinatus]AVL00944.1 hypothetical protein PI20285_09970 [Pediococcus inopinatus]WPC20133.1 DUF2188 domain-containing protein [Pediococcus inopinatus]WPC21839.1 DUF2188 domain-containing protein [Pediococcus inopinatus]WPP09233.1 DUF2188 domain-containing protein [Pediococcus inopinatus]
MPWNMEDYPASMKNMKELVRKKAIDIVNALLADGYPDDRAIPIAMKQAEKWYADSDCVERATFRKAPDPSKHDKHDGDKSKSRLLDANEAVFFEDGEWQVKAESGKQASESFDNKDAAIKRAREIVKNKESAVKIYKKDGNLQNEIRPR